MKQSLKEIAQLVDGIIEGDTDINITSVRKIEDADKGSITFLANPNYEEFVYSTKAAAIIVEHQFKPKRPIGGSLLKVQNVYGTLIKLLTLYHSSSTLKQGIHSLAFLHTDVQLGKDIFIDAFAHIDKGASIGDNCRIHSQVYIGADVKIGKEVIIYSGVKIYADCEIGDHCIIHANTVIGSDGFGFAPKSDGTFQKIPQVGNVIIEQHVEIGANTVIDRATLGTTLIKKGTKLDNLVQVAHNVEIGAHTVIAAQAGIAGSTQIGNHCQIGGQAGFVGHIRVADGVQVQAQSGVASSIPEKGSKVYGYPALSYREYLRAYTLFRKLPELEKRIRELEKRRDTC